MKKVNVSKLIFSFILSIFSVFAIAETNDIDESKKCIDKEACPKILEYSLVNNLRSKNKIGQKAISTNLIRIQNKSKRTVSTKPYFQYANNKNACTPNSISLVSGQSIEINISCNSPGSPFTIFDVDGRSNSLVVENNSPTPPPPPAKSKVFYIFVTENSTGGAMGGLAGADQKCENEASNSSNADWDGLSAYEGDTWTALLSSPTINAKARKDSLPSGFNEFPVKRWDGLVVADTFDKLWQTASNNLVNPVRFDPKGNNGQSSVYTNTNENGFGNSAGTGAYCYNWSSSTTATNPRNTFGSSLSVTKNWMWNIYGPPCAIQAGLYCIKAFTD